MYNIIQLNDKSLSELQAIAQELGIKKTDTLKKEELVYKILDEQAIAGATKKVAADKLKEERKVEKKCTRSTSKKNAGNNTPANAPSETVKAEAPVVEKSPQTQPSKTETNGTEPVTTETPASAKRKPGRPRKSKSETSDNTAETPIRSCKDYTTSTTAVP